MKLLKTLRQISIVPFMLSKWGFLLFKILLKITSKIRSIIKPGKRKSARSTAREELLHTVHKLEPILAKVSDSLSAKPELFQDALSQVVSAFSGKDSSHPNKNTIIINPGHTIIEQNDIAEGIIIDNQDQESPAQKLEQQLKNLFTEIKTSQFSGNTIAHQIETILETGIHVTNQLNASTNQNTPEEAEAHYQISWDDFIAELDEVSLSTERLQAQINQLMSCHEIN